MEPIEKKEMDRKTVDDKVRCAYAAGCQRFTYAHAGSFLAKPNTSCDLGNLKCKGEKDDRCVILSCNHLFHKSCYDEWNPTESIICPVCGTTTERSGELIKCLEKPNAANASSCAILGGKRKRSKRHTKRRKHSKRRTHRQPKLGRR